MTATAWSWDSRWRAEETKMFLSVSGLRYHDVECRILDLTENAIVCADAGGITRWINKADVSYASWYIAVDNPGAVVSLKIRKWNG